MTKFDLLIIIEILFKTSNKIEKKLNNLYQNKFTKPQVCNIIVLQFTNCHLGKQRNLSKLLNDPNKNFRQSHQCDVRVCVFKVYRKFLRKMQ